MAVAVNCTSPDNFSSEDTVFARAVAAASGEPLTKIVALVKEVNKELGGVGHVPEEQLQGQAHSRSDVKTSAFDEVMRRMGWVWTNTLTAHLRADELPPGRLVCHAEEHMVAIIDGVIQDAEGRRCDGTIHVNGYFYSPAPLVVPPCADSEHTSVPSSRLTALHAAPVIFVDDDMPETFAHGDGLPATPRSKAKSKICGMMLARQDKLDSGTLQAIPVIAVDEDLPETPARRSRGTADSAADGALVTPECLTKSKVDGVMPAAREELGVSDDDSDSAVRSRCKRNSAQRAASADPRYERPVVKVARTCLHEIPATWTIAA